MDASRLLQLEQAATDLLSPPYAVTQERRKEVEAVFLELKKSKRPYDMCKYILEHSQSDYVLFQAGSTLRDAAVREWEVLEAEEKETLRGYILHYITSKPRLAPYVREQLIHTVALMVKRATLETDRQKLFNSFFTTISQLIAMDATMCQLACSLLSALLTEYSNSSGASNVGLPIEFHVKCKKAIESDELLRALHLAVQVLQHYLARDGATLTTGDLSLVGSFLELASKVLNWDFQLSRFSPVPLNIADVVVVVLRPPRSYAPTFLDRGFLNLFFQLLGKLYESEGHVHHIVQGLTQLASLPKPFFSSSDEQNGFLSNFVTAILSYVSFRSNMNQQEIYGLSCILRRLATNFSVRHFSTLDSGQLSLLVTTLTQLTCLCAHRSVQEEESGEDSLTYQESLDHYLEVFVSLLQDSSSPPPSSPSSPPPSLPPPSLTRSLLEPCREVFDAFLRCKLIAPRGWRSKEREEGEIVDIEEDDRDAFRDQLQSIGCIARFVPRHSLPLLVRLIGECTSECLTVFEALRKDPRSIYSSQNTLDSTYEDLHWLVLIATFTMCDIANGEEVLIPTPLLADSLQHQNDVARLPDVAASVWKDGTSEQVDLNSAKLDHLVCLFLSLCRLCVVERVCIGWGMLDVLSPQLSTTVVWGLGSITGPYLHLNEDSYDQVSVPLLSVFGRDNESSQWLCGFLLDKVTANLSVWSAEETLSLATIQLLNNLVKKSSRAHVVIKCRGLWSLMSSFSSGHPPTSSLSPLAQRKLTSCLIQCGVGKERKQFLSELLQPLQQRFNSLVQSPQFPSTCQAPPTQLKLLSILEALCGLAQNIKLVCMQEFFYFLLPLMRASVQLLELYSDVSEVTKVILEMFNLMAENYVIFLNEADTLLLYEVCLALIHAYAHSHAPRYGRVTLEEAEQCDDLLLFMKMLTHITVKDYVDFGDSDEASVKPLDVVIKGLDIILSLMNEEILKFPSLCLQFYTLLNYISDSFSHRLPLLSEQLVIAFIHSLERGLTEYGSEVCVLCLESVASIATGQLKILSQHSSHPLDQVLEKFLEAIFDLMLSSSFDIDALHAASGAVFAIICGHKESYLSLVSSLVASLSDSQSQSRLMEAFSLLTPPSLPLDNERPSRIQFRKNLEQFLPFVKGFLCFK